MVCRDREIKTGGIKRKILNRREKCAVRDGE